MSKSPHRPELLAGKIFLGSTALRRNLLTQAQLRSTAWRSLFRGVYADASLDITHRDRCLAACRYLLPAEGAVSGRSTAALYGVGQVGVTDPVEVLVPRSARFGPVTGLRIHSGQVPREEMRDLHGVRVTSPVRTCWDIAQWLDVVEAVVLLDGFVRQRLVRVADLSSYARSHTGAKGWRQLLRAATLIDPGAESVQESRLRVRLVLAGLPRPVTQYVIERNGAFVARVDLACPNTGSRWSTTACGMPPMNRSIATAAGSTGCWVRSGSSFT